MLVRFQSPQLISDLHRQFTLSQGEINFPDTEVTSFTSSSQEIVAGSLFIACRGVGVDGNSFVDEAFKRGAAAAVVGSIENLAGRPGFQVNNARVLLSRLSSFAFRRPSESMRVIGITGTNGKTTTNWMLYHALKEMGEKVVRIGTLGYEFSSGLKSGETLTTPAPEELHKILSDARDQGCDHAVIEVSSHALHQHRADDISLDAAVFTNITHDHLDYHRTFEEYIKAKRRIFDLLKRSGKSSRVFCVNLGSADGQTLARDFSASFEVNVSFGYLPDAPVRIIESSNQGIKGMLKLEIDGKELLIESMFIGDHNAENLAATAGILYGMRYTPDKIISALARIPPVPGRLEPYQQSGIMTFVDYAHSPDALERVLVCLRKITQKRLILVFGCGGNRDWRKRASMGNIAARLADCVIVTSDNPRKEAPDAIIKDIMESSLSVHPGCSVRSDRADAIHSALSMAEQGDVILIAGKGHENYQIVGEEKQHFSDQEEIRKFFATRLS